MEMKKRCLGTLLGFFVALGLMLGISKTAYAETADTIVINSENFSNYFGEDGYLKESVKEGSTLDFQGTFSGNKYSLFINKKVNIISSTNNALFENTVDKDNIIKFYIGEGADYTNITGIEFLNSDLFIIGASHVTVDSIKMVANMTGVGAGTGFLSIHSGANYTVVKDSTIENQGNGGSACVIIGKDSQYNVFDNNKFIITGTSGNVLYISKFLGDANAPDSAHNTIINNKINYEIPSAAISWGIVIAGENNIIEGNKINYSGYAINTGFGVTAANNVYNNNVITGGGNMNLSPNSTAEGNVTDGSVSVKEGDIFTNNTVKKLTIDGKDAQVNGNTIDETVIFNNSANNTIFTDNLVNNNLTVNSKGNTISDNTITTTAEYAVILKSSAKEANNTVTDNSLIAAEKAGDNAVNPGSGGGNTIENNIGTIKLKDRWIQPISDVSYTGEAIAPEVVVKCGNTVLTAETDYTVSYSENTDAGEATVTVTAVDSSIYSGTAYAKFNILEIDPTITKDPEAVQGLKYDGQKHELIKEGAATHGKHYYALGDDDTAAPEFDGKSESENKKWNTSTPSGTDAGTYYVWYKVVGDKNYNSTTPACLTVKISEQDKTDLNAAIAEAEKFYDSIKDNSAYTSIASTLNEAISTAKKTAENKNVTTEAIASAKGAIEKAATSAKDEKKNVDDNTAAKAVEDKIKALPAIDQIKTTDKATIEAVKKAYDALTDDQKKKLDASVLKKLTDTEGALVAAEKKATEDSAAEKAAAELAAAKEEAQAAMNEQVTVTQKGNKFTVKWKKSSSADGYFVYAQYCEKKANEPAITIKTNGTTSTTISKINGKKISTKKNFYVYVEPYKIIEGKEVTLGKSMEAHLVGSGNTKYSNVKTLTLKKNKLALKVGKTAKIKAKVTLVNKNKKHLPKSHGAKFRFKSSDPSIATVSANGKVKGIKKGTCTVYVYSINGLVKKAKITVK